MTRYRYPYHRYNRFDVPRVNALTVAVVLFLSRHVLAFLILGIALSRAPLGARNAFSGLFEPIYMLADIPALLIFFTMLARHPKGGRLPRLIWRGGPLFLLASALLYLGLVVRQIGLEPTPLHWPMWTMIAGTILSAAYALLSPYARDLFRSFPDPSLTDDGTRGKS